MHWSRISEFLRMGGYGFYVWGSYGAAFLLLGAEVVAVLKRKQAIKRSTTLGETKLEIRNCVVSL